MVTVIYSTHYRRNTRYYQGVDVMVYVISIEGKPLMPTSNAKARKLLKQKKAKVIKREPFTIKLLYKTTSYEIFTGILIKLKKLKD